MNDKEFIKCQAEEIAELTEQLMQEQRYSQYKSNSCDSLNKEIEETETKIEALKSQLYAEKEHGKMLTFEFSRALEVIRGNNLAFESPLIEAEYQSSAKKSNISVDEIDGVAVKYNLRYSKHSETGGESK